MGVAVVVCALCGCVNVHTTMPVQRSEDNLWSHFSPFIFMWGLLDSNSSPYVAMPLSTWLSPQLQYMVSCDRLILFGLVFSRFIWIIIYISISFHFLAKYHSTIKVYFLFVYSSVHREPGCFCFELL